MWACVHQHKSSIQYYLRLFYTFRTADIVMEKLKLIMRIAIWSQNAALYDHTHQNTRKHYYCGLELELGFF